MDELLAKCLKGDKQAWDAFVDRYAPVIFSAVLRTLRGRGAPGASQTAEDLAQDVFLRLIKDDLRLLRTYDPSRASMATWLTIVARSTAIDALRRKRLPQVALDDAPVLRDPRKPEAGSSSRPTEDLPRGLLTARQQLVLSLTFDRGMEAAEIAKLLKISPQTVRSTRHKAIERLRRHFAAEDSS